MTKVGSVFLKGKMNKDLDERLVPKGEYREAQNILITQSESSDVGAIENILGNALAKGLAPLTNFPNTLEGDLEVIGYYADVSSKRAFWFITSFTGSNGDDIRGMQRASSNHYCAILTADLDQNSVSPIQNILNGNWLNFSKNHLITGINLIDDLLFWTDNYNQPRKINITKAINSAKAGTQYYIMEEQISVAKVPPYLPIILHNDSGEGDLITLKNDPNITSDYLKERFVRFSYRYKYEDGEYSTMAPFTQIVFKPLNSGKIEEVDFSTTGHDVQDIYNKTIVDIMKNDYNQLNLRIPLPSEDYITSYPDSNNGYNWDNYLRITKIEILIKEAEQDVVKVIKEVDVTNDSLTALLLDFSNNIEIYNISPSGEETYFRYLYKFTYKSEEPYKILKDDQITRVFDQVPIRAKAQEISGNRIIYGNFTENYNLPKDEAGKIGINYTIATDNKGEAEMNNINSNVGLNQYSHNTYRYNSLKQRRTYQVGIVLADKFGRQSSTILSTSINDNADTIKTSNVSQDFSNEFEDSYSWSRFISSIGRSLNINFQDTRIIDPSDVYNGDINSPNYNPFGWYSWKIVVKQQEQDYDNIYTTHPADFWNNESNSHDQIGGFTWVSLYSKNINKVTKDVKETSEITEGVAGSDMKIFPKVVKDPTFGGLYITGSGLGQIDYSGGSILAVDLYSAITTNTSDATNGSYYNIAWTTSGEGTGLVLNVTVFDNEVSAIEVVDDIGGNIGGEGFLPLDTITISQNDIGGTTDVKVTLTAKEPLFRDNFSTFGNAGQEPIEIMTIGTAREQGILTEEHFDEDRIHDFISGSKNPLLAQIPSLGDQNTNNRVRYKIDVDVIENNAEEKNYFKIGDGHNINPYIRKGQQVAIRVEDRNDKWKFNLGKTAVNLRAKTNKNQPWGQDGEWGSKLLAVKIGDVDLGTSDKWGGQMENSNKTISGRMKAGQYIEFYDPDETYTTSKVIKHGDEYTIRYPILQKVDTTADNEYYVLYFDREVIPEEAQLGQSGTDTWGFSLFDPILITDVDSVNEGGLTYQKIRIDTDKKLGGESLELDEQTNENPSKLVIQNYEEEPIAVDRGLTVLETEPFKSKLDIFYETSTSGLIKDLNLLMTLSSGESLITDLSFTVDKTLTEADGDEPFTVGTLNGTPSALGEIINYNIISVKRGSGNFDVTQYFQIANGNQVSLVNPFKFEIETQEMADLHGVDGFDGNANIFTLVFNATENDGFFIEGTAEFSLDNYEPSIEFNFPDESTNLTGAGTLSDTDGTVVDTSGTDGVATGMVYNGSANTSLHGEDLFLEVLDGPTWVDGSPIFTVEKTQGEGEIGFTLYINEVDDQYNTIQYINSTYSTGGEDGSISVCVKATDGGNFTATACKDFNFGTARLPVWVAQEYDLYTQEWEDYFPGDFCLMEPETTRVWVEKGNADTAPHIIPTIIPDGETEPVDNVWMFAGTSLTGVQLYTGNKVYTTQFGNSLWNPGSVPGVVGMRFLYFKQWDTSLYYSNAGTVLSGIIREMVNVGLGGSSGIQSISGPDSGTDGCGVVE